MSVSTAPTSTEQEQIDRANASGLTPVVFIHGLFLLPSSWDRWAAVFEAAYNDSRRVTELFVRNALTVVNRELGAGFDQRRFVYEARWDPEHESMDIGLRAREAHTVSVQALDDEVAFEADEPLRVEISSKFRREHVEREVAQSRLRLESWWTDGAGDFAVALVSR